MTHKFLFLIGLILGQFGGDVLAVAEDPQTEPTVEQREFIEHFLKALREKSFVERTNLLHSASRRCINSDTREWFEIRFRRDSEPAIPSNYKVRVVESQAQPSLKGIQIPATVSHRMQISYGSPQGSHVLQILITLEDGKWVQILPCPDRELVKMVIDQDKKTHGSQ